MKYYFLLIFLFPFKNFTMNFEEAGGASLENQTLQIAPIIKELFPMVKQNINNELANIAHFTGDKYKKEHKNLWEYFNVDSIFHPEEKIKIKALFSQAAKEHSITSE